MKNPNIFTYYKQKENQFTNGLISLLRISQMENPQYASGFLKENLGLASPGEIKKFGVLQEKETGGTEDAELSGENFCVWIENKIASGALDHDQINRHLENLYSRPERDKRLVLLTPDDSKSMYIRQFVEKDKDHILHLEWKRVYEFLEDSVKNKDGIFSELVHQFLLQIRETIYKHDFAGVIQKIQFGDKTGVYENTYLNELKKGKFSARWNTRKKYVKLDGTRRKLMLYDRTRHGITVEVEIERVEETQAERDFPWTNWFAPCTLCFFEPPIPSDRIQDIFNTFRRGRAIWNVTHDQYLQLTAGIKRSETYVGADL